MLIMLNGTSSAMAWAPLPPPSLPGLQASRPMFVFWSPHIAHVAHEAKGPEDMLLQVPERYIARFSHINNTYRRLYTSMVGYLDEAVGEVVDELKASQMWDNTVLIFLSDNGGPVYVATESRE